MALLVVLYGLCILPSRLLGLLVRRDPLHLRPIRQKSSYWLVKTPVTDVQSYFSQSSPDTSRATGQYAISVFRRLSALYARRQAETESASSGKRRHDIPDEIYTLW